MQPADSGIKPGPAPNRGPMPAPTAAPLAPLPSKPPSTDLLKVGITANIDDINQRVQEITEGHQKLFGHQPSPGLVYDIVRGWSQNKVPDISTLFDIPTSQQDAAARHAATLPPAPDSGKAAAKAKLTQFVTAYSGAPDYIQKLAKIHAEQYNDPNNLALNAENQKAQAEGFAISRKDIGFAGKGLGQMLDSLVTFIPGVYTLAKSATLDARDFAARVESPVMGPPPKEWGPNRIDRTEKLGVSMGKQMGYDFTHLRNNWGFATMDAWAIVSAGAGTGARIGSAVSRAGALERASAFERAGQAIEGFRKPEVHSGFELGYGAYSENIPAFENAALRFLQGKYLKGAQDRLLARQLGGEEFDPVSRFTPVNRVYDLLLSEETLLNRQRMARNNIEYAIATAPTVEMSRLTNWTSRTGSIVEILARDKSLKNVRQHYLDQKLGVDKALQLIMTDSPDPVSSWRSFHQRMIDDAQQQKKDFTAQNAERTQALRETHDFHRQNAEDLKVQAKELEAGTHTTLPTFLKGLAGYEVPEETVRPLAKQLLSSGFGNEHIPVRESKSGRMVIQGERGHHLHAAAKLAGIEDVPVKITTASREQLAELRKAAREQAGIANKIKPDLKVAEKVMNMSEKARARKALDFDYQITHHEGQLLAIDRAVDILTRPSKRFKPLVDRAFEVSRAQELGKEIVYGLDPEIGFQHLAEIAAILRGEHVVPILDDEGNATGRLGTVVPGSIPDEQLRDNVRAATQLVRAERKKSETLQLRLNRPTAKGEKAGERPVVAKRAEEAQARVNIAEAQLAKALHEHEHLGSTIEPLKREITGEGEVPGKSPELDTIARMRQGEGSAYSGPLQPETYRDAYAIKQGVPQKRRGRFGMRPPKDETTSTVRMSGDALVIGDNRWDVSRLLSEEQQKVFRGAMTMVQYQDLWHVGVKESLSEYHMPIRDIQSVPAHLRKIVRAFENNIIEPDVAALLDPEKVEELRAWLYPDRSKIDTSDPHVRWVDERMAMNRFAGSEIDWRNVDRLMQRGTGWINDPWRLLVIFGSPAYLLNAGGAAVTLAVEHGVASPGLFGRAIGAHKIWNPEVSRMMDQLAGSTHAAALITERNPGLLSMGTQKFAEFWQKYTDRSFRKAALIGELYKRGLIHDGMAPTEVMEVLRDGLYPMMNKLSKAGVGPDSAEAAMRLERGKLVIEAARVARKQMLDFDKMSWPERAVLRHIFFVYAFLRAGSIWSLRFMGEHPVKWAVTANAGRDRRQQIEQVIGKVPAWFYQGGYMPFNNNEVFNPVQFNMPATIASVLYSAQSLFSNAPYSNIGDTLGAAGIVGRDILTGKTSSDKNLPQSNLLPSGRIGGSFLDLLEQTPEGYAVSRSQKLAKQQTTKFPAPTPHLTENDPLSDASARERSMLKLSPFELDGFWNNWGRLIGRTADPQTVNALALHARYWRDIKAKDPVAYVQHQVDLLHDRMQLQATAMGEKGVPVDVQNGVNLVAAREVYIEQWKQQKGIPSPGDRQLAVLTIGFLKKEGIINDQIARQYRNQLSQAHGTSAWRGLWIKWLHANGTLPWAKWNQRVDTVNFFNTPKYAPIVNNLKDQGLGDFTKSITAPQDTKWAYGRVFEAYKTKRAELSAAAAAAPNSPDRRVIEEEIRQLDNKHSDIVTVHGVQFPSPRATVYGKLDPDKRVIYVRSKSVAPWWTMDSFDRQLLTGTKPDPTVEKGYEVLAQWMQEATDRLKPGQHLPSSTRTYYAQTLADRASKAGNPSFLRDLQFAGILPKADKTRTIVAERLRDLTPIQGSLYHAQWDYMLTQVSGAFHKSVADGWVTSSGTPNYTGINSLWTSYYLPKLQAWIAQQGPGFQKEVNAYVTAHHKFLQDLIHHG